MREELFMTYFDPRVYDPERLRGADRDVMRGYDAAVTEALGYLSTCAGDAETGVKVFDKLYRQVVAQVRDGLEEHLAATRIEQTCLLMEASGEDYDGDGSDD